MQMMPSTQEYFGIDSTASPEQQIRAGVKYIKFLDKSFEKRIPDALERINFILASYNIGPGHIFDAQKLAQKLGKNPLKWFNNVDTCLLSKSNPDNYNDPSVQFGYCKGNETFSFVNEVITRFNHYKNVLKKIN
jgi:membrane-bound lytic murein transglycosylase F